MAICIYDARTDDFTTNGLSVLSPISCEIEETENDMFELTLEHPIDESNRWAQIQEGAIIKAPVPARESPLYEEDAEDGESAGTQQRKIWEVARTTHGAYLRSGPGTSYKKLAVKHNGDQVIELEEMKAPWIKVCVVDGGAVGYMSKKWLDQVGTESVETGGAKPDKGSAVKIRQSREQLFRIYEVKRDSANGTVTAKAMHIFYDLLGNIVGDSYEVENEEAKAVMDGVAQKLINDHPFTFHTYAEGKVSGDYGYQNPIEIILDAENGVAKQTGANLFRDNFDVFLLPDVTRDLGVTIRRRKNSKGVQVTSSTADIVTRIIPEGKGKDDDVLHVDSPGYIDSPRIDDYPIVYAQRIEYDVQIVDKDPDGETTFKKESEAKARLEALAREDFEKNGVDLPTYSMDVDFVLLANSADFAENQNYGQLQAVHIGDTVRVIDSLIGVDARLRVTGYTWDAASSKPRYTKITLGDVQSLEQKVYNSNIAGGISGSKIAPGSASGNILRDLSIQYAKISVAAIQQLNASSITALTARIQEIVAGKLTTDELYAQFAEMFALKLSTLTAKDITTDNLAAAFAAFTVITAGTASFDQATIKHLVAEAMNLEFGTAGQVFIKNLAVEYAQMVGAAIGNLCIKASDGNYYRMDVDANGNVTATLTTVTEGEISAGQTGDGQIILETNITASNLSTGNLLATYALINRIDAARISVDELFAREAFISLLRTSRIVDDKSIEMIVGDVEQNAEDIIASRSFSGDTPPTGNLPEGKIWVDTSENPSVIRRWLGLDVTTDAEYSGSKYGGKVVKTPNGTIAFDRILQSLLVDLRGDGDLSADNPYSFDNGWDSATLTVNGSAYTLNFWQTVFGGELDWTTGKLTIDRMMMELDGTGIPAEPGDGNAYGNTFRVYIPAIAYDEVVCSHYPTVSEDEIRYGAQGIAVEAGGDYVTIFDHARATMDADEYNEFLYGQWELGTPVQILYKLSTPEEIQLNVLDIQPVSGEENRLSVSDGDLTVDYTASGWETVSSLEELNNGLNEALRIANAAVSQEEFQRIVRTDAEGLHVGDNLTDYEVLIDSASVNVVASGKKVSSFSTNFIRLDNMQIRKVRGGLAISVYNG